MLTKASAQNSKSGLKRNSHAIKWTSVKVVRHNLKFNTVSLTFQGISGVNLNRDNVEVLGNMACTLDSSYIQNADPLILEKLKDCKDFSDSQVAAMETLLLSGTTQYGYKNYIKLRTIQAAI